MAKQISFPLRNKTLHSNPYRVANCALWFLKLPHSETKEKVIVNVNILGGSSSVLETIGNSARRQIIYPRTPNLLNPLPASLPSPESLASMSPSPTSTQSSTDKNEALINVLKAIDEGTRY